ncbi:MAG: hypothetical protein KBE65_04535 [Phycisphaerae bacterium]|nr:hypothetical protein [Phycisphaerae bacterium]
MTIGRLCAPGRKARAARVLLGMAALLWASILSGCGTDEYLSSKSPYARLATPYAITQLGRSTSLDVLNVAHDPAYPFIRDKRARVLLTQGDTVVGYSGQTGNTRRTWLNLIAFDEFRMTARRKYFFCVDERARRAPDNPKQALFPARKGVLLDAEFIIDPEVLTTPYATEDAQRIEIVRWLADQFRRDLTTLVGNPKNPAQGDQSVMLAGMMVSQIFQGVLAELGQSPGRARNLSDAQGVRFPHMSLREGHIRLLTQNDLGAVKIRVDLPMTAAKKKK